MQQPDGKVYQQAVQGGEYVFSEKNHLSKIRRFVILNDSEESIPQSCQVLNICIDRFFAPAQNDNLNKI
jgi:hypothetical protein